MRDGYLRAKAALMSRTTLNRARYIVAHEGLWTLIIKAATVILKKISLAHPEEQAIILRSLKDKRIPRVMIDVGAGTGTTLSDFINSGWRVFAFEPEQRNRDKLVKVTNHYPGITIDPRAVSDRTQQSVPLYTSDESCGIASLTPFRESHIATDKVDTITLSAYMEESGIRDIGFLKVDTEGHDLRVLQGFPWDVCSPDVVMCEFEDSKTLSMGYSWMELAEFLVGKSYSVLVSEWWPIRRYGTRKKWRGFKAYPCKLAEDSAWGNLIAARTADVFASLVQETDEFNRKRRRLRVIRKAAENILRPDVA